MLKSLVTWNEKTWLVLLTGLTIFVRLGYVLVIGKPELSWGDEFTYDQLARNILGYGCFCFIDGEPSVLRAPLYPAILALIYAAFGHSYMAVLFIQALASGFSAFVLALIGKQLSGSIWVGLLAGLIFALHPLLIFTTGLLYSETLYLLLLLVTVYLWLRLIPMPRNWLAISLGSGLLLGLSILMKPNLMLFPIWLVIWGWILFKNLSRAIVIAACITLTMLIVVLPWSWRNFQVTGEFVPVSANAGLNLWQGNNSEVRGGALDVKYLDPLPELTETERDAVYQQWGIEWIRTHPADFIKLIPLKLYRFFSPLETSNRGRFVTTVAPLVYAGFGLYYLLAIVGLIKTAPQWPTWLLVYMLIAYPVLLAIVFYGGTRYSLVVHPFLTLFVAEAIIALIGRIFLTRDSDRSTGKRVAIKWFADS